MGYKPIEFEGAEGNFDPGTLMLSNYPQAILDNICIGSFNFLMARQDWQKSSLLDSG